MPAIEVTTRIGCRVMCSYCPQDKILGAYPDLKGGGHMMTLPDFEKCLGHLPTDVDVHFSGFTEPWLNPRCTDMVVLAADRGHRVRIFSTLAGLTLEDVERLEHTRIRKFVIHLPSDDGSMNLVVDDAYIAVLERLVGGPMNLRCKFHGGRMHPRVAEVVGRGRRSPIHTRAGNVEVEDHPPPRWLRGEITCKRNPVEHVLLPNGDVVLCCMDWSMKHRIGNLLTSDYESIVSGPELRAIIDAWKDESQDVLCRVCDKRAIDVDLRAKVLNTWLPAVRRRLGAT